MGLEGCRPDGGPRELQDWSVKPILFVRAEAVLGRFS